MPNIVVDGGGETGGRCGSGGNESPDGSFGIPCVELVSRIVNTDVGLQVRTHELVVILAQKKCATHGAKAAVPILSHPPAPLKASSFASRMTGSFASLTSCFIRLSVFIVIAVMPEPLRPSGPRTVGATGRLKPLEALAFKSRHLGLHLGGCLLQLFSSRLPAHSVL